MRTADLTNGERLLIERRRSGKNQKGAALAYDVSLHHYRQWEENKDHPPEPAIGKLEEHEMCYLLRRRADLQLSEFAKLVGVSEWWVTQMESGRKPCARLLEYWDGQAKPWRGSVEVASKRA